MRRAPLIIAVTLGISLACAAPALATRYAAPAGSPTNPTCAATAPCTLQHALVVSAPGEEIIMAQGNYVVAAPAPDACTGPFTGGQAGDIGVLTHDRFVHGVLGRPRPRIIGTPATCVTLSVGAAGRIRHVQVENYNTVKPETYALVVDGAGFAYDVVTGGTSPRTQMRNGAHMYDSVLNSGADGIALRSYFGSGPHNTPNTSSYIINVTAHGQVLAASVSHSAVDIDCTNSIATGGFRLENHNATHLGTEFATARLDHCIGATSTDGGFQEIFSLATGNNPAGSLALAPDGFHELATSNSINNGLFIPVLQGDFDIDGGARFNEAIDIGADEFGSGLPTIDSGFVVSRAFRSAKVAGTANPGGVATAIGVDYGPSAGYGQHATAVLLPGDFTTHALVFNLPGMIVNAPYHYRFVASNGSVLGEDRTIVFPDADHDGYFANVDCNEANVKINPGAKEIVGNKVDENCDGIAKPFPVLASDIGFSYQFPASNNYTRLTALTLTKAKKGSKVKLSCKGHGCPFKTRTTKVKKSKGKLSLSKLVRKGRFAKNAKLELKITLAGHIGKDVTLTFRKGKAPKKKTLCLTPGKTKPGHC